MFNFSLQQSPDKIEKVIGFGDTNYDKIEEYHLMRSPVNIQLKDNNKYDSLLFNEVCNIEKSKSVLFSYEELEDYKYGKPSLKVDLRAVSKASPDSTLCMVLFSWALMNQKHYLVVVPGEA